MPGRAIAAAVAALALAGCSGTENPPATDDALAGTVNVFAASSLREVFALMSTEFSERHPGVDVVLNLGGSSTLAGQIVQGAPADVFAAANEATMGTVREAGLVDSAPVFATNTLELVVPAGNPGRVTGLADLARPELFVALCAPEVPCGAASAAVLAAAGVTPSVDSLEQEVDAVLTKVSFDGIDAGLVYRTDVLAAKGPVEGISFAGAEAATNHYPIGVTSEAANSEAAAAFVEYVLSPAGQELLEEAGFGSP